MNHRTASSWNFRCYWPSPKSRVGRIARWLSTAALIAFLLRLILGRGAAGGFFLGWAIAFLCFASPFLLILMFRFLSRRLLWKVSNRLIVTYLLMGLAPVVLFATLTAIAGYIIAGQYSINSALSSLDETGELLRGETMGLVSLMLSTPVKVDQRPLNFEQTGNPREADISLASLQNGVWRTVPIESKRGSSPASPFEGQAKPAWMKVGFHNVVVMNGKLYLCRYSMATEGPKTGEVLGALEINHGALNAMAAPVGRMLVFSGFGLRSGDVGNAEKEANTAEQEADSAQTALETKTETRQNLLDEQREAEEQMRDAQGEMNELRGSDDSSPAERKAAEEGVRQAGVTLGKIEARLQGSQPGTQSGSQPGRQSGSQPDRPPITPSVPASPVPAPPQDGPTSHSPRAKLRVPAIKPESVPPGAHTNDDFTAVSGGVLPVATHFFDQRVYFTAPLPVVGWSDGRQRAAMLVVISRPSALYTHLFSTSVDIGSFVRDAMIAIAVLFALLELLALWMATRLSRTITRSVAGLYRGTTEIDKGNLGYRVRQEREDQLGALATSFNTMAGSIEDLLVQQREKERLISELAIAQEVQRNLFPHSPASTPGLQLHAVCLPARTVSGDYFDFIFEQEHQTCIALGDISGKGISAALLMASLHSAVRAFSLGDRALTPSPARLLELLNRHLFSSTQANKYATLFLAFYDQATRRLVYSNGGHLPPFVLSPDGRVRRLDVGGSVVGLLDGLTYDEATIQLHAGDLLVAYTDGLTEPERNDKEFGEDRLLEHLLRLRDQALPTVVDHTFETLKQWIGNQEQPDDMTLLLVRQL